MWIGKKINVRARHFQWQHKILAIKNRSLTFLIKKTILTPRNLFLQQEINYCRKKSILTTRNQLLQQEINSYNRKFFCFTWHTELVFINGIVSLSWKLFFTTSVHVHNFRDKVREFKQRFRVGPLDFVATWFPGFPLLSHPGHVTHTKDLMIIFLTLKFVSYNNLQILKVFTLLEFSKILSNQVFCISFSHHLYQLVNFSFAHSR